MAVQVTGEKAFTATSTVTAFRRVKLTSASGTAVEHAGADATHIGVAQNSAAAGEEVTVRLIGRAGTCKVAAAGAFAAGATLYGAAAGLVDDAASGTAVGTALEAAATSGDVVEVFFDNGVAAAIGPAAVLVEATNEGALPIVIHKICNFNATPDAIAVATTTRKLWIFDWLIRAIDNVAANITVKNAGTSISTAALAKGTTVDAITHGASLVAAQQTVASGAAITVESSEASADIELTLLCLPIA